jgi:Squalene-hopene cyclase C-terminal domain
MVRARSVSQIVWPAAVALVAVAAAIVRGEEPRLTLHPTASKPEPVPETSAAEIEKAIGRGVAFLLKDQNRDGSWGTAQRTKNLNIYAPLPEAHLDYRAGVTALCVQALLETHDKSTEAQAAIERGEKWLFENLPRLRRSSPDVLYNIWGHAYGIQTLAAMYNTKRDDEGHRQRIREQIQQQIKMLERFEAVDGGWGYYDFKFQTQRPAADTASFMSAAVLIALQDAKPIGVEIPRKVTDRAIASINRQQRGDASYLYGEYLHNAPVMGINLSEGSLGRTQACNAALRMWGDERLNDDVISICLDRLFSRNIWLDIGRKRPIPHESFFQVAGYFYYFGHYYAARCIELLPPDRRPPQRQQLAYRLVRLQEKDGTWWDYPLYNYHQQYGTAFAIMSLVRCLPK